jgi:hypothetical protein
LECGNQNDPSKYDGALKIDYYTVTIYGYNEATSFWGSDSNRLFNDYLIGVEFKGYSEDGKIFIELGDTLNSIHYKYYEALNDKLLEFDFGGRKEILQCPMDY